MSTLLTQFCWHFVRTAKSIMVRHSLHLRCSCMPLARLRLITTRQLLMQMRALYL